MILPLATPPVLLAWTWDVPSILLVVGLLVVFVLLVILLKFFKLWIQAYFSNANISLFELVGMWLRKVDSSTIVRSKIALVQANLPVETKEMEAHFLAGGNVDSVARALIAADRARIQMDFKTAAGIDLAGRDVLDAIQTSVNPKVIDCPDPRKDKREVAAVAKDGIQVLARARVTVRTSSTISGSSARDSSRTRLKWRIRTPRLRARNRWHRWKRSSSPSSSPS